MVKRHWKLLLSVMMTCLSIQVLLGVVAFFIGSIPAHTDGSKMAVVFADGMFQLCTIVVGFILSAGVTRIVLELAADRSIGFRTLFSEYTGATARYFEAAVVSGVVIMVGYLLLIIPGIVWSIKYRFAPYIALEKKVGPLDAMRQSAALTQGHKSTLFGLDLAMAGITVLSVVPFLVALLVDLYMVLVIGRALYGVAFGVFLVCVVPLGLAVLAVQLLAGMVAPVAFRTLESLRAPVAPAGEPGIIASEQVPESTPFVPLVS